MAWVIAIVGSLAGFLFGYDEGIIAGTLPLIKDHFTLSNSQVSTMTSALPFGALFGSMIIGAVLASRLVTKFGRKKCLILSGCFFIFGAITASTAPADWVLVLARFILGIAIGSAAVTTPLYLSESAPAEHRGAMIAVYQLAVSIGIVCAYLANYFFIEHLSWRLMFATCAIPAFIMVLGLLFLPDSPRWLLSIGRTKDAIKALRQLRKSDSIEQELNDIEIALAQEPTNNHWRPLFEYPLLPVLLLGTGLFAFQQLCGINVIIYYAPEVFKSFGLTSHTGQILATVGIGFVNVVVTLWAIFYVDKIGRRKLLLFGFAGTFLSLATLSIASFYPGQFLASLSIVCLTTYIISFAVSLGPIPYIAMAEIFPLHVRGAGMGLSSVSNWGFNGIVVFFFPLLQVDLGISWTFMIFSIFCFIGLIYCAKYIPETKNISLEAIERHIMSGKPLQHLGRKQK